MIRDGSPRGASASASVVGSMASVVQTLPPGPASMQLGAGPASLGVGAGTASAPKLKLRIKLPVGAGRTSLNGNGGQLQGVAAGAGSSLQASSGIKRKLQELLKGYPEPEHATLECLASVLGLHGEAEPFTTVFPQWGELLAVPGSATASARLQQAHEQEQPAPLQQRAGKRPRTAPAAAADQEPPLPPAPKPAGQQASRQAPSSGAGAALGQKQQKQQKQCAAQQAAGPVSSSAPVGAAPGAALPSSSAGDSRKPNANGGAQGRSSQIPGTSAPGGAPAGNATGGAGQTGAPLTRVPPPPPLGSSKAQQQQGGKAAADAAAEAGGFSSNSDQATTFAITFHSQNPSPTEVTGTTTNIVLHPPPLPPPPAAAAAPAELAAAAAEQQPPAKRPRAAPGCSVGVQTSDPVSLLPAHLFGRPLQADADAPGAQQTAAGDVVPLALAQLTLPPHLCGLALPPVGAAPRRWGPECEREAQRLVEQATALKYRTDAQRGPSTAPWTLPLVAHYVDAALLYMRAIDIYMLPCDPPDRNNNGSAATLCLRTSEFLLYTSKAAETAVACAGKKGAGGGAGAGGAQQLALARECVKALCDRLAARCLLCETFLTNGRYRDFADRLDRLLLAQRRQQQQQQQQQQQGGGKGSGGDPSPDDSHASSAHRAGQQLQQRQQQQLQHVNVAVELGALQQRMKQAAQQTARYADLVRRATGGLQALMERDEARGSAHVVRAAAHMSCIALGGPCNGALAVACGEQALASLRHLW